jgi:hypothetical protein
VLIARLAAKDLEALLDAKKLTGRIFAEQGSYNDANQMNLAVYGSFIHIAPMSMELAELVFDTATPALVMVPDAIEKDLWHVVGVTRRSSHSFFASKEKTGNDDFAPADLLFNKPKK